MYLIHGSSHLLNAIRTSPVSMVWTVRSYTEQRETSLMRELLNLDLIVLKKKKKSAVARSDKYEGCCNA